MSARHPAAFINVIAEDGTKDEAISFLQETWDDYIDMRQERDELLSLLWMARDCLPDGDYSTRAQAAREIETRLKK